MSEARAELLEDGGAAAAGPDFFRSPQFLEAEGVTHTLRIEHRDGAMLAPLLVREIPGSEDRDAISPYGYPGLAAPAGLRLDPATIDFSATGLVSAFIRHTLGTPPLRGARERNVVQIADPALPAKSRGSDRNRINRNRRDGYEVAIVPGSEVEPRQRDGFLAAYEETMRRTEATAQYFFGADYFERVLAAEGTWLATALAPGGEEIAAASIVVRSDDYLHYYLSGTADSHLRASPMKNVVAALTEFSASAGLPLNLGGGIRRGDRLEEFKRGFANREQTWKTSEIVCDRDAYERLSSDRPETEFFPAYRAPN